MLRVEFLAMGYLAMQAVEDGGFAGGDESVDDIKVLVLHCYQNSVEDPSLSSRAADCDEGIAATDMKPHICSQK